MTRSSGDESGDWLLGLASLLLVIGVVGFGSAVTASSPVSADGSRISYQQWAGGPDSEIAFARRAEDTKGLLFLADDLYKPVKFCDERSGFVCFETDDFAFAYPVKRQVGTKSWTHNGITYDVVREGFSRAFFGRKFDNLILVRQPKESTPVARHFNTDHYYLYSTEFGLVAFGDMECSRREQSCVYLLVQETGFGAIGQSVSPD